MKRIGIALAFCLVFAVQAQAAFITIADKTTGGTFSAAEFNQILDAIKDGTLSTYTKTVRLAGDSGGFYNELAAGAPEANRYWRLPIVAPPSAGTTSLMNVDEYGNMGLVAQAPFLTTSSTFASFTGTTIPDTSTVAASLQALETAVEGKQATLTAASQAEMEAGTESAIRSMSPLRVFQAIASWMSTGHEIILDSGTGDPATTMGIYFDTAKNAIEVLVGSVVYTWMPNVQYTACVNPQNVYDNDSTNHWLFLSDDLPAAFTVTKLIVTCDADPTTEPTVTFKECDGAVGCGNASTIEAVTTTAGRASQTASIDDAAISSGHRLIAVFSDPDDAIKTMSVTVEGHF